MKKVVIEINSTKHPGVGDVRAEIRKIGPAIDVNGAKVRSITFHLEWRSGARLLAVEVPAHLRVFDLVVDAGSIYACSVGLRPVKVVYWAEPGTMTKK